MNSPTLNFEKVTFSDGSSLDLDTSDVVVFVGPNNSGKSLALVELELHLAAANRVKETKVIRSASTRQEGSPEEYKIFSQENIRAVNQGTHWTFTSSGGSISTSEKLEQLLPTHIHSFKSLFCKRIPTETRILDSNPVDAIDGVNDIPVHPIHMMFKSADIESRISKHFRRAFAEDLIADRAASSKWSLLVGQRLLPSNGEDRITPSYLSRVRDTFCTIEPTRRWNEEFCKCYPASFGPNHVYPSLNLMNQKHFFTLHKHASSAKLLFPKNNTTLNSFWQPTVPMC